MHRIHGNKQHNMTLPCDTHTHTQWHAGMTTYMHAYMCTQTEDSLKGKRLDKRLDNIVKEWQRDGGYFP